MILSKTLQLFFVFLCLITFSACEAELSEETQEFGIFTVLDGGNEVEMNGEIGTNALSDFQDLLSDHPDVDLITIKECGGSTDDEYNLLLSKLVHDQGIDIHLASDGLIASGGVDFFVAGYKRTIGSNTMIGVHSWSDGKNEAVDFPKGHENHIPYINYYKSIGFSQSEAEEFYYFTINAARANGMHYMTDEEIETFGLLTD